MVFIKIPMVEKNLTARIASVKTWCISAKDKRDIVAFLRDLSIGKINLGYKISESRQLKYLGILKIALEHIKKESSTLSVKDMERLDLDLTKNMLKRLDGKPFAEETKAEIKRFLKIYLKWKLKNDPAKFAELTSWLDTKIRKKKTPEFLNESEILKLFRACKTPRERFIVAVLFDSGARAEEFFNIRYEDIEAPNTSGNYYKIDLKEEYSKTKGRIVGLFWEKSTEAIRDYLNERVSQGIKPGDRICEGTYDSWRFFLKRLGARVLGKRVYFHLFRHSSATYYASKLNRQQLCKRYGWAFSSDMPDVYINRTGIDEKEIEEKFTQTELTDLKRKLEMQQQENRILGEKIRQLEVTNEFVKKLMKKPQVLELIGLEER